MVALKELFTTDIGLLSLFVIAFVIGMGIFLSRFFSARIREEAAAAASGANAASNPPPA
jgi:hypothetical protein